MCQQFCWDVCVCVCARVLSVVLLGIPVCSLLLAGILLGETKLYTFSAPVYSLSVSGTCKFWVWVTYSPYKGHENDLSIDLATVTYLPSPPDPGF